MKMIGEDEGLEHVREHVVELLGVAARHDVVARGQLESGAIAALDVARSPRRGCGSEFAAERRTSRCRSLRRIVEGPLAGIAVATSRSGTRILSPRSSSLSVGTRSARRSSA